MDANAVRAELGLDDRFTPWLEELAALPDPPPRLVPLTPLPEDGLATLLRRLGCSEASVADAVGTRPDPGRDRARWWLLERSRRRLDAVRGDLDASVARWPELPEHLGTAGSCFPLHLFGAVVPDVRAWHAARGVPDAVSWATLADLGRHEAIRRRSTGRSGLDAPWWMLGHLRGLLYEVGGLQYAPYRVGGPGMPDPWYAPEEADALGPGFLPGDLSVGLHVPEGGSLATADVEISTAAARELLDRVFPTPVRRILTLSSWLLDDQLADLLGEGSRIVPFQRGFRMVPGWIDGDASARLFVFGNRGTAPEPGPGLTRLQRAVLEHGERGGRFRWRTGWRDLPA